jgi:beta-1,4-N-acetylglucosaminyltransferase
VTRHKILFVLGEGGHSAELLRLVPELGASADLVFIASEADQMADTWVPDGAEMIRVRRPRGKDTGVIAAARDTLVSFGQAACAVRRLRPSVVITSGPAIGFVVSVAGWLSGARVIFVETISRVTGLSLTGRLMRPIADRYFVQWPGAQADAKGSIYAGRLM